MVVIVKCLDENKLYILEQISFISAVIVLFLIPTYIWFIPPFMILWGISWILESRARQWKSDLKQYRVSVIVFTLFMAFYLWQLAGISYSPEKNTGWKFFLSRLSLFLFPLVLTTPGEKIRRRCFFLLRIFSAATIAFIIFCFGYALFRSINLSNGHLQFNPNPKTEYWMSFFYGYYFSINQHPSYLSIYAIISIFIAFESWFDKKLKDTLRRLWLAGAILLILSVYLLSSRSGMIVLLILLPIYLIIRLNKGKKILIPAVIVLISMVTAFFAINSNSRTNNVLSGIKSGVFSQIVVKDGRIIIWEAALNPIRQNLILGIGTGGVDSIMKKEYLKIGNEELVQHRYNLHNQYLEVLLENGLIGLVLFLIMMGFMFYIAIEQRNLLYGIFILTMLVFFSFETVLNRLQGVAFFSLFSFLLLYVDTTHPDKIKRHLP